MALVLITVVIIHHRWFPVNLFCLNTSLPFKMVSSIISPTASPPCPLLIFHQRDRHWTFQVARYTTLFSPISISQHFWHTFSNISLTLFLGALFFFFLTLGSCGGLTICAQILCYSSLPSGAEPNSSLRERELDLGAASNLLKWKCAPTDTKSLKVWGLLSCSLFWMTLG